MTLKIKVLGLDKLKKAIQKEYEEKAKERSQKTVIALVERLKENTPVDTGEARDGWKLSKDDSGFSIENEVEHIVQLNEGSSQQAPSHFIEHTILGMPSVIPNGNITRTK